jgi:predicted small secreted protein
MNRMEVVREEFDMVRKIALSLVLAAILCLSFGCNTIQGLGEDISVAGASLTKAAGGP